MSRFGRFNVFSFNACQDFGRFNVFSFNACQDLGGLTFLILIHVKILEIKRF